MTEPAITVDTITVEAHPCASTQHWSATRLKSLLLCPKQFCFAYVDKIPSIPTAPLVFGRVLHEILLFIHQGQMESNALPSPGETLLRFDALWQQALEEENPFFRIGAATPEQHTRLGHEVLRSYLRSQQGGKPPLAAELTFELSVGDETLRGVIDRLDEKEDGLVVVDFKSGARKLSPQELDRDLQLTVYAFAAQRLTGRSVSQVAQLYLRDSSYLSSVRGPEDFAHLVEEILPYARRVQRESQYPAHVGYWCNWCQYRELCQAERRNDALARCQSEPSQSE